MLSKCFDLLLNDAWDATLRGELLREDRLDDIDNDRTNEDVTGVPSYSEDSRFWGDLDDV
jgi:hypothetical protein